MKQKKQKKRKRWIIAITIIAIVVFSIILYKNRWAYPQTAYLGQNTGECYIPNEDNIVYENSEKNFGYVNNMILVFFSRSATDEKIAEIVESIHGQVVGKISGINQYQIQVEATSSNNLESICDNLLTYAEVKNAIIDYVVTTDIEETFVPNDPWKDTFQGLFGVDWNEDNPSGTNWWIEATKVLSAWEYENYFTTINVGIVDNGFDVSHEDLNMNLLNGDTNNAENHGTHIAGIIGATTNNNVGISGILSHVNLYGVDCYATSKQEKANIAVSSLMDGIVTCLDNQCKVVNISSGIEYVSKDDTKNASEATARTAIIYLIAMLDSYDEDFIIVQSAGNGNKAGIGVDSFTYNGYFCAIDETRIQAVFNEFDEREVKFDHVITIQDVLNSYMVVGAVDKKKKNGQWQLAEFSNYGETISVCAPGVDVFSTIVSGGLDGSYGYMTGTSMASPIVAAITALVWSVDPTMTAGEIKDIIVTTASSEPVLSRNKNDSNRYCMINAQAAVDKMIDYMKSMRQWIVAPESILYVYNLENELASNYTVKISLLDLENIPQGPNVSAKKINTTAYVVTDAEPFSLVLDAGIYEIVVSSENIEDIYTYYALVSQEGDVEHFVYTSFEANQKEIIDDEPRIPDVIDYVDEWYEMIAELSMIQVSTENNIDNIYEVSDFNINISSWGGVELRNDGYQGISISGVVLGDEMSIAQELLEKNLWMCGYSNDDYTLYITKRNNEYYYLWLYHSSQNDRISNWYLSNWNEDEFISEMCAGYDVYINVSEAWKKAYIKFIIENGMNYNYMSDSFWEIYKLVNINGDDIPELYINFGTTAGGDMICSYYNNSVVYQYMWNYGFTYMEGQNLFMDSGGHMDVYYDKIYSIDKGEFVLRYNGEYGAKDNSSVQIDADGYPIYDYYWNGIEVSSKEEYQQLLSDVYDIQQASYPYDNTEYDSDTWRYVGNGLCDYQEILQAIVSY